ncbi:4034_t:CDS:1 [Acaulospora morrowiae]|uniref:4034_t:CDS:1 n=1 Tax=Acaulospora morrowiae TaxID=94023 RepID=A0A9N9BM97_9GLOM|nr:4034_t:CDS:1 [Acaulospora morrowiae]
MVPKLNNDCIKEILEFLYDDNRTLFSCLLVSRVWCRIGVIILWRNPWRNPHDWRPQFDSILAFLSEDSIKALREKRIIVRPTKPQLFDYLEYVQSVTSLGIMSIRYQVFKLRYITCVENDTDENCDVVQDKKHNAVQQQNAFQDELWKLFLRKGVNLKSIGIFEPPPSVSQFPEAMRNLSRLESLNCLSIVSIGRVRIYEDLVQICRNLKSLYIDGCNDNPVIAEIISVQNGLKELEIINTRKMQNLPLIGHSLATKQGNSLEEITFRFHICLSSVVLNCLKNLKRIYLLDHRDPLELKILEEVKIKDLKIERYT